MKDFIIKKVVSYLIGESILSASNYQKEIADKMGTSYKSVNSAINGNDKYLTDSFLKKMNKAFDNMFNEEWLLTGSGEMITHNNISQHGNRNVYVKGNNNSNIGSISTTNLSREEVVDLMNEMSIKYFKDKQELVKHAKEKNEIIRRKNEIIDTLLNENSEMRKQIGLLIEKITEKQ